GRLAGNSGFVYAFEPMNDNFEYILQHIALNNLHNIKAIHAGIAASSGTAWFVTGDHSAKCHRSESGSIRVAVHNLEEYVMDNHLPPPSLIKMDIEGEEIHVIPSILDFLVRYRTKLLISTHENGSAGVLGDLLSSRGYSVRPLQCAS